MTISPPSKFVDEQILEGKGGRSHKQAREIIIDAQNISKRYGQTTALKNVSIQLSRAEKTAIIGPSGAGKTSLLKVLSGSLLPSSGSVAFPTQIENEIKGRKKQTLIAFIPQNFGLAENLSVAQNISCGRLGKLGFWRGARSVLFPTRAELESIYQLLLKLGIGETLYKPAAQLSGGEAQRVAIGRALYQQAEILFADEPIASLDPERAEFLLALLTRICDGHNFLLCVSLHNLELARRFFDRLIGLRDGEIVFDLPPSQVTSENLAMLYARPSKGGNEQNKEPAFV